MNTQIAYMILYVMIPLVVLSTTIYLLLTKNEQVTNNKKYQVTFKLKWGTFLVDNNKRGVSVI